MTIRAKLTIWYSAILFVSIVLIGALSYNELVLEKARAKSAESDAPGEEWEDVVGIIVWCGLPAALVGIGGGWFMMKRALAPVSAIANAASKIDERSLSQRLKR